MAYFIRGRASVSSYGFGFLFLIGATNIHEKLSGFGILDPIVKPGHLSPVPRCLGQRYGCVNQQNSPSCQG